MNALTYILAGGFLKGYRTYILAGVGVVTAVANFAIGDSTLNEVITQITLALSVATTRAATSA